MARIAGINIPPHQHAEIGLTAIFGIGRTRARKICEACDIAYSKKVKDLTDGRGPMSSLYATIELGYAMGLYRQAIREDLHKIREVRNAFAHARKPIGFRDPEIMKVCAGIWSVRFLFPLAESRTRNRTVLSSMPRMRSLEMATRWV